MSLVAVKRAEGSATDDTIVGCRKFAADACVGTLVWTFGVGDVTQYYN